MVLNRRKTIKCFITTVFHLCKFFVTDYSNGEHIFLSPKRFRIATLRLNIKTMSGLGLNGHLTFSSAWEWGYAA